MKNGIKIIEMALCVCAALGWWGVFYPELTMTPDTYRVVKEAKLSSEDNALQKVGSFGDDEVCETADWDFDREIYFEILQADASQIRFKSKLLMSLKEIFE